MFFIVFAITQSAISRELIVQSPWDFHQNYSLNNTLIENARKQKSKIFDFRLILRDRITYGHENTEMQKQQFDDITLRYSIWWNLIIQTLILQKP